MVLSLHRQEFSYIRVMNRMRSKKAVHLVTRTIERNSDQTHVVALLNRFVQTILLRWNTWKR